jgi:putative ATP-dependent endonuclease of OLD family
MYLSELRLWNFRKYTNEDGIIDETKPHLAVPFTKGLNVLIGENDSGKTAVIDAIKLVTKTHSMEWIHLVETDFSLGCDNLRIEIIFTELSDPEAAPYTDKVQINPDTAIVSLHLVLEASKNAGKILPYEVKAYDGTLKPINANEKELIKATYLRVLRDADYDLTAKKNSRLSQILMGHELFQEGAIGKNTFESIIANANDRITEWFKDETGGAKSNKSQIKDVIDTFIKFFLSDSYESELSISDSNIKSILEKISIGIKDTTNMGLGSMNRLFMATELLHLRRMNEGVKLCLIEELEAHLHPQAQMKVIEGIQQENEVQFILTTHSPNLASKVKISMDNTSVVLCKDNDVYPLTKGRTKLEENDYVYLENFLDVTKSNLFFAKGVIIVEGWAEDMIIPVLANNLDKNLTRHEVSVVNVGSTAYLHYARILMRKDGKALNYPVSIVTDSDVRPKEDWTFDDVEEKNKLNGINAKLDSNNSPNVKLFLSTHWTLEWCLFMSDALSTIFKEACMNVHSGTDEFKKTSGGDFDNEKFRNKLAEKLKDRSLDKVAIASEICLSIKKLTTKLNIKNDDTAYYLVQAINHVCK